MKELLILLLLGFSARLFCQELDFFPIKNSDVIEEDYNKGKYILENAYDQIKEHGNWVYADYWNIAVGYLYMGYDKKEVLKLLQKSKAADPVDFCNLVQFTNKGRTEKPGRFATQLGEAYAALIVDCKDTGNQRTQKNALKKRSHYAGLNYDLIKEINGMLDKDQQYRRDEDVLTNQAKWARQKALDDANSERLKTLFDEYGYIGKSLVGTDFCDYACLIFEHSSDLAFQETYLPLVIEAMQSNELNKSVVRLLIDRLHLKKTGKQIFGSQVGAPMDSATTIMATKKQFGF